MRPHRQADAGGGVGLDQHVVLRLQVPDLVEVAADLFHLCVQVTDQPIPLLRFIIKDGQQWRDQQICAQPGRSDAEQACATG